jgi:hypothetical protein
VGLALALSGGLAAAAAPAGLVKMDAATQTRLGVATEPVVAATRGTQVTGFARALDPGPLAQLESDIAAATAAAAASQAEANRTKTLNAADQTVSKQAAEAAAAQARADASKLSLLRHRVGLEWSPALARWPDGRRAKLVADIASGRAALVRIDSASGLAQARGTVALQSASGGEVRAEVLGPMRTGDPRLQSTGVLALVTGPRAVEFGAGTVTPATLASSVGAQGVVIPRAALMRSGGRTFVYVRKDATDFERREVGTALSDPSGLFVTQGFRAGEAVVTKGAAEIFAAQSGPVKED